MDIHRCRFVDWPPSPINALAFSQSSGPSGRGPPLRLAVGRANGNIEIWDPRQGNWYHEKTFFGGRDRSVEGLAWTTDPDTFDEAGNVTYGRLRLFSIGYSNTITEWDLISGTPLRQSSGSHGDIFCIAAQPRPVQSKKKEKTTPASARQQPQDIVAGCADGSVILFSTADDDLTFKKYIARSPSRKTRCLSVAWQNAEVILVGGSDSTVRIYNATTNLTLRTISLGAGIRNGPREKLCWAIQALADGTIVTGDSSGDLCWWDSHNYGQLQRLRGHDADVLCLAASTDGQTIMSGSMDRRVCTFKRENKKWSRVDSRRIHQHDVKAMTSFESKSISITVSGGIDAQPVVHPLREWGNEYSRALSHTPQSSPVTSAQRLVVSWWTNQVSIWRVLPRMNGSDEDEWTRPNYNLMSRLSLKVEEHITQAAISSSGDLLAVSTSAETKLFALRRVGEKLRVRKIDAPSLQTQGAVSLHFSEGTKWLATIDTRSTIRLYRILELQNGYAVSSKALKPARIQRPSPVQTCLNGSWGSYSRSVVRAAFSGDSRMFAVADLEGHIDSWEMEGQEEVPDPIEDSEAALDGQSDSDSDESENDEEGGTSERASRRRRLYGQSWVLMKKARHLPKLTAPPLVLSFIPSNIHTTHSFLTDTLFTATATHTLSVYSLKAGTLHEWSRRNPASTLPDEFKLQRDRAEGCLWDVRGEQRCRAWLYGANWLAMFDLTQDLPVPENEQGLLDLPDQHALTNGVSSAFVDGTDKALMRKRKRADSTTQQALAKAHLAQAMAEKKASSGAGSQMKSGEIEGMDARGIVAIDEAGNRTRVFAPEQFSRNRDEEGDEDVEMEGTKADAALVRMRREGGAVDVGADSEDEEAMEDGERKVSERKEVALPTTPGSTGRPFFLTNRYRPILGIVPLAPGEADGSLVKMNGTTQTEGILEVALVERPLWEVDMPPRFGVDWDREP